jgi:hypothetical protein
MAERGLSPASLSPARLSLARLLPLLLPLLLGGLACRFDGSGLGSGPDLSAGLGDLDPTPDVYDRDVAIIQPPDLKLGDVAIGSCAACPLGCVATNDRCAEYDVSNVEQSALRQGSGPLTINGEVTIDTTAATIVGPQGPISLPPGKGLYTTKDGAYVVFYTGTLRVEQDATLSIVGKRPVIILAAESVTVAGTIDASAAARQPGAGGGLGGKANENGSPGAGSTCEASYAGDEQHTYDATGPAGGSFAGKGGSGGNGPAARAPCAPSRLIPLVGGTGGGGGARRGGSGGGGGGAVQISAWREIIITATGVIHAGGGGGGGGEAPGYLVNPGSGGGGGSGGAILLEAPRLEIAGTVVANGGGAGGGGLRTLLDIDGGDSGQDAPADGQKAAGGKGGSAWTGEKAGVGGEGAAGSQLEGGPGTFAEKRGGGGGGGAGRIQLTSLDGKRDGQELLISPSAGISPLTLMP